MFLQVNMPQLYEGLGCLILKGSTLDGGELQHAHVAAHVAADQDTLLILVLVKVVVHRADLRQRRLWLSHQ